jgi:hypothetical protein
MTLGGAVGLAALSALTARFIWGLLFGVVGFLFAVLRIGSEAATHVVSSILLAGFLLIPLVSAFRRPANQSLMPGHEPTFVDRLLMDSAGWGDSYGSWVIRREALALSIMLTIACLAPQFLLMSVVMFRRALALKRLDDGLAVQVISVMMKGESRLKLDEIRERFRPESPLELIGGLTALDGVVLIRAETDSPALTVAPRVTEEYKEWLSVRRREKAVL